MFEAENKGYEARENKIWKTANKQLYRRLENIYFREFDLK